MAQLPPTESSPPAQDRPRAMWYRATSAASIGIEIAVCIILGTAAGRWAEREWTHWSPWTTLIGFGIGLAAAVRALVRTAKQAKREFERLAAEQASAEKADHTRDPINGSSQLSPPHDPSGS